MTKITYQPIKHVQEYKIQVGDFLKPDGWDIGELLQYDDGFSDSGFPGCEGRIQSVAGDLAVNVKVTGRDFRTYQGSYGWLRVKIEFVGDCEESQFCGGWLKPKEYRQLGW